MIPSSGTQDLTVKGESIERVYGQYIEHRYVVNRRYQRKLIWTLDEKVKFIDSIIQGFPVPIILLAESTRDKSLFEIIDGMQRLNAITSFIENEFSVSGMYFDLNTMATTKELFDTSKLTQKDPKLQRDVCVKIASYLLPLSIYEFTNKESVDEVFRRINSGGRKLSRQELRAAGSTGFFAQAVRKIAAKVRGDDSHSDVLKLNDMKKISITNRELQYGIPVEAVFWVKEGILTKEQVRQSRDEELIADIVAYMVSETPPPSRTEYLDVFFGILDDDDGDSLRNRYNEIESAVQRRTMPHVINDFQRTLDELRQVLTYSGVTFRQILFPDQQPDKAPRYFQAVFLAFYKLVVRDGMQVSNTKSLVEKMLNSGQHIEIQEGGRWGADNRNRAIDCAKGMYQDFFKRAETQDPAVTHWITQLENILTQSFTEQNAYDFKQGFLKLADPPVFDSSNFDRILETCVGISNIEKGFKGYILIGIADTLSTAQRVNKIFNISHIPFDRFFITGIEHEALAIGTDINQFFQQIIEKIRSSKLSDSLKDYIARNIKLVRYYEKSVFVIEIEGQDDPSSYNGAFYIRNGASTYKIEAQNYVAFFRRYLATE